MEVVERVRSLIHTALYDTGGESVEGAFVDHWVSNASVATEELEEVFNACGFTPEAGDLFRAALRDPGCPVESGGRLLTWLKKWTAPLIREMLSDSDAHAREIAVQAAAVVLDQSAVLPLLKDEDAAVRAAAVRHLKTKPATRDESDRYRISMLSDSDPRVRKAAARTLDYFNSLVSSVALFECWSAEPDAAVRSSIVDYISERTSIYTGPYPIEDRVGAPITNILVAELKNDDVRVRESAAMGLRKFSSLSVAEALYERLNMEPSRNVRVALLRNNHYTQLGGRARDLFIKLLETDEDAAVRTEAAFHLASFGTAAETSLVAALKDQAPGPRRAAVMSLGRIARLRVLPVLLRLGADASKHFYMREFESAVRDITIVEGTPGRPPPVTAELSNRIRDRIRSGRPGSHYASVSGLWWDQLNSLPIHSARRFFWSIRPDGAILRSDPDRSTIPAQEETDLRTRFAVVVQGARHYPELAELIPPPPRTVWLCRCLGRGWNETKEGAEECASCGGMGWVQRG